MSEITQKEKKDLMNVKKVLHPNSPEANAIVKRNHKSINKQRLSFRKMINIARHQIKGEKLMWFKQNMLPDVCPYTEDLVAELLLKYIGRYDEELEQIKRSIERIDREDASREEEYIEREDTIMFIKTEDQRRFDTYGLNIPDILSRVQCEMLKNWDGDLKRLPSLKFRRFGRKHLRDSLQRIKRISK